MSEPPAVVLWLDPGGVTGLAWIEHTSDGYAFSCAQAKGTEEAARRVYELLAFDWHGNTRGGAQGVRVGWEQYIVTAGGGRSGDPAPALEVIGAVKWLCHWYMAQVLPPHVAGDRKGFRPELLKSLGWYQPGMPHAMDAAQHLGVWLSEQKPFTNRRSAVL